jgi:hypothetical protein
MCNQVIETSEFLIRISPSHSYNADRAGLGWMSGWFLRNVYAACSDCVVVLALRELVAWEFSVRRPRGGSSTVMMIILLLSSYEVNRFYGLFSHSV